MKKTVAILTLLSILLQTFSMAVTVAEFYANRDYIAKNLCENRDKPQMHCNGKCCLKKKLEKEGKEQAPNSNRKSEQTVTLFFGDNRSEIVYHAVVTESGRFVSQNDLRTFTFHSPVFHPPGV